MQGFDILADALLGEAERKQAEIRLNRESDEVRAPVRKACLFKVTRHLKKEGAPVEAAEETQAQWERARRNMTQIPRPPNNTGRL